MSLIYWDIDNYKKINNDYGHANGDLVLIKAVKRVYNGINTNDLFGRICGEEFVILATSGSEEEAKAIPVQLRLALANNPFRLNEQSINVTASFGVINIQCNKQCYKSS
ncbi:GGDEF domain-containing protein [Pseudoalteromonas sp. SG45-5]|uniref:GGDEF domain-containing protein n=1 Tax=unclassified Pseudoalteromonas TaxID=194690 RepID=UPI0015FD3CC0|nr:MULTISPECIES: GGDEF domain-containing protein [unclassified Pseudoalteromonas]MBB1387332.1 GGDEF domain-containing protein [Pseudoalteromonas sp. SG45-5]MBB1394411.1 GGDEF domain-containing protein [Pseudoalteromonas sp. SG44-4]MBB1449173.1 GGDEF domain-containing protein [Pseudoalteromonas sp. SG41-6]